jgi:hypothetical protein
VQRSQRPRLTLKVLYYAVFDVVGMLVFASGLTWLVKGQSLFVANVPRNAIEAAVLSVAGIALMIWAAAQIMRELLKRPPDETP